MHPIVNIRYLANGYLLTSVNQPSSIPATLYVATLPEVVFWIDQIFNASTP